MKKRLLRVGGALLAAVLVLAFVGRSADAQDTTTLLSQFLNAMRSGTPTVPVGTSMTISSISTVLNTNITPASNTNTSETDLMTYSLPANTLISNGQGVRVTAWGTLAATASTKTVKMYFGATAVDSTSFAQNNGFWYGQITVLRLTSTTQTGSGYMGISNTSFTNQTNSVGGATPAETLTGAVTIKVTGTDSAASGGITQTGMKVEWVP